MEREDDRAGPPARPRWPETVYWILTAAGALLPLTAFVPWLARNGPDVALFVEELFASRIGALFALDIFVSAAALAAFIVVQGRRDSVRWRWLPLVATFCVGVSCGLPLFLALRERALAGERRAVHGS